MYTKEGEKEEKKNLLSFLKNPITFPLRLMIFCVVQHRSTRKGFCKCRLGLCFLCLKGGVIQRKALTMLGIHKILSHGKYLINQKQNSLHSVTRSSNRKYMKLDLYNILKRFSWLQFLKTSLLYTFIFPSILSPWISALSTCIYFHLKLTQRPQSFNGATRRTEQTRPFEVPK